MIWHGRRQELCDELNAVVLPGPFIEQDSDIRKMVNTRILEACAQLSVASAVDSNKSVDVAVLADIQQFCMAIVNPELIPNVCFDDVTSFADMLADCETETAADSIEMADKQAAAIEHIGKLAKDKDYVWAFLQVPLRSRRR